MSLLRRLLLSVSVALLGVLVGTLLVSSHAARSYLTDQLQMQSENAATSLALVLSQPGQQDPVVQELLMSALFDTGRFRAVELLGPEGHELFVRKQPEAALPVPAWFATLMPLPLAQTQRAVSDGWRQVGVVQITVDNRAAQQSLWRSTLQSSAWVLLAGLAWALFVTALLRWFRKVLQQEVQAQVLRIGTHEPQLPAAPGPSVAELGALSHAIADTHVRVLQQEQVQQARIESLELETHSDPVTQLPNRKYFMNELSRAMQSSVHAHGHVLMMRLRDLQAMNQRMSRQEVDAWLQGLGAQLKALLQGKVLPGAQLARLNGSDFALIVPGEQGLVTLHVVQAVCELLQSLSVPVQGFRSVRWACALTAYQHGEGAHEVLTRLDQGLMKAESSGKTEVEYVTSASAHTARMAGEGQWRSLLQEALQQPQQLQLEVQTLRSAALMDSDVRHEASLQLRDEQGQWLKAGLFLPAAVRLGMSASFDVQAVEMGLQWLAQRPEQYLVVRVSLASLGQPYFLQELRRTLTAPAVLPLASGLVLEVNAHALEIMPDAVAQLVQLASESGVRVGLRRLEQAPRALIELAGLRLRFVKIGGFFAEQAISNPGVQYLIEAMVLTALGQGVRIYVTDSVSTKTADWLRTKGVYLPLQAS